MEYLVEKDKETGTLTARYNNHIPFKMLAKHYWKRIHLPTLFSNALSVALLFALGLVFFALDNASSFSSLHASINNSLLWFFAIGFGVLYALVVEFLDQQMGGLYSLEQWKGERNGRK